MRKDFATWQFAVRHAIINERINQRFILDAKDPIG